MKKIKINRLYKDCIDIRSYIAKKAFDKGESLEIIVEGLNGRMILTPLDIKTKVVSVSKEFKSKIKNSNKVYKLISYTWNPVN